MSHVSGEQAADHRGESGASFIEYLLLVTLLVLISLVGIRTIGESLSQSFSTAGAGLNPDQEENP